MLFQSLVKLGSVTFFTLFLTLWGIAQVSNAQGFPSYSGPATVSEAEKANLISGARDYVIERGFSRQYFRSHFVPLGVMLGQGHFAFVGDTPYMIAWRFTVDDWSTIIYVAAYKNGAQKFQFSFWNTSDIWDSSEKRTGGLADDAHFHDIAHAISRKDASEIALRYISEHHLDGPWNAFTRGPFEPFARTALLSNGQLVQEFLYSYHMQPPPPGAMEIPAHPALVGLAVDLETGSFAGRIDKVP